MLYEGINVLVFQGLVMAVTGSVVYGIWRLVHFIGRERMLQVMYPMLQCVLAFWIFPIGFLLNLDKYFQLEYGVIRGRWLGMFWSDSWMRTLLVVWLIGFGVSMIVKELGFRKILSELRKDGLEPSEPLKRYLEQCCDELGIHAKVNLISYPLTGTPFTYYHKGYHIVINEDPDFSEEEFKIFLCHELIHIKRRHTLLSRFAVILEAIQWFNPLIYLYRKELGTACEIDCDLHCFAQGISKKEYGTLLLKLEAMKKPLDGKVFFFIAGKSMLSERIKAMTYKGKAVKKSGAVVLTVILVLLGTVTSYGASSLAEEAGNQIVENTVVRYEEPLNEENTCTEYERTAAHEDVTVVNMDEGPATLSGNFTVEWDVPDKAYFTRTLGSLSVGDEIAITVRTEAGVHVGIWYNGTERYIITGDGITTHTFTVNTNGTHRIFAENLTGAEVHVELVVVY